MCIAIFKPRKEILTRDILAFAFEQNQDGAGFAFAHKGKLTIKKGFFTFEKFWVAFNKIQAGNPAIVHFRIATSGEKDEKNCHPFLVNDNVAIAHNGRLTDWTPNKKSDKSDTWYFVDAILKPILEDVPTAYLKPAFHFVLEKTIEAGNKMIFLDAQGNYGILREYVGDWVSHKGNMVGKGNGCWFSNDSYKVVRRFNENAENKNNLSDEEMDAIINRDNKRKTSEQEMDKLEDELAVWHEHHQAEKNKKEQKTKYPYNPRIYHHELSAAEEKYLNDIVSDTSRSPREKAVQAYLSISDPSRSDFRTMMS